MRFGVDDMLLELAHQRALFGEVGFAEQSTFNRAFRRRFGDAPGNIRGRKG